MKYLSFLLLFLLSSCAYNEFSNPYENEPTFSYCVKPIFEQNCMGCHSMGNPDGIMPLTNHQEIQNQVINGTVIESLKREFGFMPKFGERLSEEQILIIENWKNNGALNN